MRFRYICFALAAALTPAFALDEINEDDLFGSDDVLVDSAKISDSSLDRTFHEKSVGISGLIAAYAQGMVPRKDIESIHLKDNALTSVVAGNLMLDIRIPVNVKAFANVQVLYLPSLDTTQTTMVSLPELFVDANIAKKVYLRAGKQVLQWGRCTYWNPTDLINIEPVPFVPQIMTREGTFGLKMHVPFGTAANIYGFIDMHNTRTMTDPAAALRFEFLAGSSEIGVSAWGKDDASPVFGFDFSTRLPLRLNFLGEIGLSYGDNRYYVKQQGDRLMLEKREEEWIPRIAVGLNRKFDWGNYRDRIDVQSEFYYDFAGYERNVFDNGQVFTYDDPVRIPGIPVELASGTLSTFYQRHGLYEPNRVGKYYLALHTSVAKFPIPEMTWEVGGLGNLQHGSYQITSELTYTTIHNLFASLLLLGRVGHKETEYTFAGNAAEARISLGLLF